MSKQTIMKRIQRSSHRLIALSATLLITSLPTVSGQPSSPSQEPPKPRSMLGLKAPPLPETIPALTENTDDNQILLLGFVPALSSSRDSAVKVWSELDSTFDSPRVRVAGLIHGPDNRESSTENPPVEIYRDRQGETAEAYHVGQEPTLFLISEANRIQNVQTGTSSTNVETLATFVDHLLHQDDFVPISLERHFTATLQDSLNSPSTLKENNLVEVPVGRTTLGTIPFEIEGVVQLLGRKLIEWGRELYPKAVNEIEIDRQFDRLHLLHGAGGVFDPVDTVIGHVVLHYDDGTKAELPIVRAQHVQDWWGEVDQAVSHPGTQLAWAGSNAAIKRFGTGGAIRLYRTTFTNPHPDKTVRSIDYVSAMNQSSPFMIGLTLEP